MANDANNVGWLNYLHLQRFWSIAREGGVASAARRENVSASTISQQLQELEQWLGQPLFERKKGRMVLTEEGRITLQYAEDIFTTGRELLALFRTPTGRRVSTLRIGAIGPLSKNLQFDFIQPLLGESDARVLVVAGPLEDLVQKLQKHEVDVVLSNMPARSDSSSDIYNHLLGEMPVYLAGARKVPIRGNPFPRWLNDVPLFLPTRQSLVRADFDLLLAEAGLEPNVRAEVDDMALLRLLALSGEGLALVPAIVVKHELGSRRLPTTFRVPRLVERFYALTLRRRFANPLLERTIPLLRSALERASAREPLPSPGRVSP